MTEPHCGTIAQLVYAQKHVLDFTQIVGDLHALLVRFVDKELIFEWDCDDIALFDFPSTRIALGWDTSPGRGYSACLTVSVAGQSVRSGPPSSNREMCSRLVERIHQNFPALAILWHETDEFITADIIDRLVENLPPVMQLFPFQEPQWMDLESVRSLPRKSVANRVTEAAVETAVTRANALALWATRLAEKLARKREAMNAK
jgi:hypothetical protein